MKSETFRRRKQEIELEIEKIDQIERKLPKEELHCIKNGNRYKWFVKSSEGLSYLPKDKKDIAEKLALKKYYNTRKNELNKEFLACDTYLRKVAATEGETERILNHPEYGKLLEKYRLPWSEELRKWQGEKYEKCTKHKETLTVKGTQGKMVRSKSEAIIDKQLYYKRIPFRYEQKLVLNGVVLYPDFVIRHTVTGAFYYWEHFGLMDDEDYRNNACDKIRLYCNSGIIPSINLILTFETAEHPLSGEMVEKIIMEYFGV